MKELLFNTSYKNNNSSNNDFIEPNEIDNIIENIEDQIASGNMDNIINSIIEGEFWRM